MIPDFVIQEGRASAIPDRLWLANIEWVEGDEAVQILAETAIAQVQRVNSYVTQPAKRILKRYEFAAAGGWLAYGCNLDGSRSDVALFKPRNPRQSKEFKGFGAEPKLKTVKYETPEKCPALPILPIVDEETAEFIYKRHRLKPLPGETFWQVIQRSKCPIAITEGLKKALSLIAHGIPAIAIRGIAQWRVKGTDRLHPVIEQFATNRRKFYIFFDQDEKLKTRINVRTQISKLGDVIEKLGCKAIVEVWSQALGKGIDDVLAACDDAQTWIDEALANPAISMPLKRYRSEGAIAAALSTIEKLNQLSFSVERLTEGEYLSQLPPLQQGKTHAVVAPMNSGKTFRMTQDWIGQAKEQGWLTLILCPLNSLGQQTAVNAILPHIHDFGTKASEQQALWSMVSSAGGVVMCPDSLHRIPDWFWSQPVLLVLDEANQVIEHTISGNTLGKRWEEIVRKFAHACRHAAQRGAIVLSEASLPDRAIKAVQALSGADDVRVFRHTKQGQPWQCTLINQVSAFRGQLLRSIQSGDRILFVTSSQEEGERIERVIKDHAPKAKAVRIDSETNEGGKFTGFFENPNTWLQNELPQVLILSPSAKSGVSIEGGVSVDDAYFSSVWGYFSALATDSHMQLLGRYRPAVPRYLYVPPFITGNGNESLHNPISISRRLHQSEREMAGCYDILEMAERDEDSLAIETAAVDYLSEAIAASGAQKSISQRSLINALEASGHDVTVEDASKDAEASGIWKDAQEKLWRDRSVEFANIEIEPETHTPSWASETLEASDSSREKRLIARKIIFREQFPGCSFDDAEECYHALFKDHGLMYRGTVQQARAENPLATKELDRSAATAILQADIKALHRLPKNYVRAILLSKTGILALLDDTPYSNHDDRAIAIKNAALRFAKAIGYWLRLQIKDSQTPVEICNKLLKKLGLDSEAISRPGRRGEQCDRLYQVVGIHCPIRTRLLEAARRKLSESVSTTRNRDQDSQLQIMDTAQNPHSLEGWDVGEVRELWSVADTDEARDYLRQTVPSEVLRMAIAS